MEIHLFDQEKECVVQPAGSTVFSEGDAADCMYAVLGGRVEIRVRGRVMEEVGRGGVFGEMALVEDRPRSATAVVVEEARLVPIERSRFLFLVQQNPFFALQLMAVMAGRLRRMDGRV